MSRLSRERWQAVSPYLDRALECTESELVAWREALGVRDPALLDDLDTMLGELAAARREGFLEDRPAPPPGGSLAGHAIGGYTLVSPLGRGGMGSVWLARRSGTWVEGQVALKVLHQSLIGASAEERFKREGRILGTLQHPHVAHLVDAGVASTGQPYLVIEHVDGTPVDAHCDEGRLDVRARVRLVLDLLDALAHAHANLVVHRDVKPSNVLVTRDGRLKVLDFGIAKLLDPEGGRGEPTGLTREGGRALTPSYAAPEQLEEGPITVATDVYAVGVLLFELLTGRHPAGAARHTPAELWKTIVEADPPAPSDAAGAEAPGGTTPAQIAERRGTTPERLRRLLRGDLDTIVLKALKKEPRERYASATAMADDLRRYLAQEPIAARPDTFRYRTAKFVRRNRIAVVSGSIVLLALTAGLAGTIWLARVAARQRDAARAESRRAGQINEFNFFLLSEVGSGGRAVTMHDILERAERIVDRQSVSDEALSVELLTTIGEIYAGRQESADANRVLKRAYEASQRVADPVVRASAACDWARPVGMDDPAAGARLIDAGLALTSDDPRYDDVVATCLLVRASLATEAGDAALVLASARAALARLGEASPAPLGRRADALQALALGLSMQGDAAGANQAYGDVLRLLERMGHQDTSDTGFVLHNWAFNVEFTSPLEALAMRERMIAIFEGEDPDAVPMPGRLNYANNLNRLARYAEARKVHEQVLGQSRRQVNHTMEAVSGVGIARACRGLGDLACARSALHDAAVAAQGFPPDHPVRAYLAREQGLVAEAEGRAEEARRLLRSALAIDEELSEKHVAHVETLVALAGVELRLGSDADAERHAKDALSLAETLRGGSPRSAWVGLSLSLLARIAEAKHDLQAARRALREAVEQMKPTLGGTHPAVVDAERRLASLR